MLIKDNSILIARCQDIQTCIGLTTEVPDFENISELGMAIRLALHIRGLPNIEYEVLKSVACYYLGISTLATKQIVELLAEVEFVRLFSVGKTIKTVTPTVPYYESAFDLLGEYAIAEKNFNEVEQLAIKMVDRLAKSPENKDRLFSTLGAEKRIFDRNLYIGTETSFLKEKRIRGQDILINPAYFTENSEIFADHVVQSGAVLVENLMEKVKKAQGWPLQVIENTKKIGPCDVTTQEISLLKNIAQDGMVKPPSIKTTHAGLNHFMFTPAPTAKSLSPLKKDIYERALSIVSAIRQGQHLPRQYAIRNPAAVLWKLKTDHRLGKATTEFTQQYKHLLMSRVGKLTHAGGNFYYFELIPTKENLEAINIAYSIVATGNTSGFEIDDDARYAFQQEKEYIDSITSQKLITKKAIDIDEESKEVMENLFLRAGS